MTTKKNTFKLETSLEALEDLIETMEDGDLPLEKSLALFEKGINLTKQCQAALREAEQKVQILLEKHDGTTTLTKYEEE